ncbi:MAG: toprim domain-containing protein [Candidatus Pacebacteria bacterium]|nr:toprim domain-containing protein [Candidatus Paceibacterota bacterium]
MNSIDKLIRIFSEFPGIGPKQARRFVYFLITRHESYIEEFKREITELRNEIETCVDCKRYFSKGTNNKNICSICADSTRDNSQLMIVSRDIDFENIEKSHFFNGKYFILGGVVPILDKNPEQRVRLKELLNLVNKMSENGLREIIMGLDANSEGEYTTEIIKNNLSPLVTKYNIKISELGRGLSTGTELEYSDSETIKNALKNRS